MINTPAIKDLILEGTRIGEIRDFIAEGREQYGMQTFDQCLADLVASGEVTFEVAKAAAEQPVGLRAQDADVLGGLVGRRAEREPTGSRGAGTRSREADAAAAGRGGARRNADGRARFPGTMIDKLLAGILAPVVTTFSSERPESSTSRRSRANVARASRRRHSTGSSSRVDRRSGAARRRRSEAR